MCKAVRGDKIIRKMKKSLRNARFSALDGLLRRQGFEATQRGSHVQYRRAYGTRFSVVKPHGADKTVEVTHDPWDGYFAEVVELLGCMTDTDTLEELWPRIEDPKRGWIAASLEHGDLIPEPRDFKDFSGKVNLRMPRSLRQDLARRAKEEGVSFNRFRIAALARAVGRRRSAWLPRSGMRRAWSGGNVPAREG